MSGIARPPDGGHHARDASQGFPHGMALNPAHTNNFSSYMKKKTVKRDYGVFQVGLKILLRKGGKVLFLRMADGVYLDIPGGRIDNVEYRMPLEKVIAREVREELGGQIKYVLGKPLFHFRRARHKGAHPGFVFCAVYDAEWKAGEIKISFEHKGYEWINSKKHLLKRADFGQEEEYRAFKKYFAGKKHA